MIQLQKFTFNIFMVNTYLLYDETNECIIIDAACYEESEQDEILEFIERKQFKLVRSLNTHCHIDHVLGNGFIAKKLGIYPEYHKASIPFFHTAREIGNSFGYSLDSIPDPKRYIETGETIKFGNAELKALYTPGHADGSVSFYCEKDQFVITGDVLFKETIGRTDLPSGDFNLLMRSIHEELFTLPEDTVVYPGHGPETTIGYEMRNNPFIR
jgi:hydroxyacylglutathione hydrolase